MESLLSILQTAGLFILGLSLLVFIHELGHFLPAKLFGMRVEKFYLFFDWPTKLFSIKHKGTEYGIGILPFGGYVKIAGIIDESMDTEHAQREPASWEFRAKPVWQRFIVMVGGVTMNIILGILIFSGLKFAYGDQLIKIDSLEYGVYVQEGSVADKMGVETGDVPVAINGQEVQYFNEASNPAFLLADNPTLTVRRDGRRQQLQVPDTLINALSDRENQRQPLFQANFPSLIDVVDSVDGKPADMPARKAGLQDQDRIIQVDSVPTRTYYDLSDYLHKIDSQKTVQLTIVRGGDTLEKQVTLNEKGALGVMPYRDFLEFERRTYGLFAAIGEGTAEAFNTIIANIKGIGKMISGEADVTKNLAGPVKIASFYQEVPFWPLTAMLSMILAFMNILPIPALDGGHIMFLLIEGVMRREPSLRVRMVAQQIGMVLLLSLMVFIIFNDIIGAIG
jgi:regulator of sigma E protease